MIQRAADPAVFLSSRSHFSVLDSRFVFTFGSVVRRSACPNMPPHTSERATGRAVVVTALRVEYDAVRAHLTNLSEDEHSEGDVYERGLFRANERLWEVGIVEMGMGNPNAAQRTERAITHFRPERTSQTRRHACAISEFLNYSGRWDELLTLTQRAEEKALAAEDLHNAGWRAYQVGYVHSLRGQAAEVLAWAARCAAHWEKDARAWALERAAGIQLRGLGHALEKNYSATIAAFQESLSLRRTIRPESENVVIALKECGG